MSVPFGIAQMRAIHAETGAGDQEIRQTVQLLQRAAITNAQFPKSPSPADVIHLISARRPGCVTIERQS